MAKKQVQFENFNDGVCALWQLDKTKKPTLLLGNVRFQERTVGIKRNFEAEQAGHTVAKTITFTDGIGTYKNSAIASGAIAFAQFRAGQVSTLADSVLGVYPNAGSVTIISKMGQSGALPVLILVINP